MDIRLKTLPVEWEGKRYELCCNMNVLADVQERNGGSIKAALEKPVSVSGCEFLAAMLNDYADSQGWPAEFTPRTVGRKLPIAATGGILKDVMALVIASVSGEPGEDTPEKNG